MVGNCFCPDIPDKVAVAVHRRVALRGSEAPLAEEWLFAENVVACW